MSVRAAAFLGRSCSLMQFPSPSHVVVAVSQRAPAYSLASWRRRIVSALGDSQQLEAVSPEKPTVHLRYRCAFLSGGDARSSIRTDSKALNVLPAGIPSRYVTRQLGQLSLAALRGY